MFISPLESGGARWCGLFERLARSLSSQESRGANVVVALSVALMLVSIALLFQLVDFGSLLDPPYPNEETPLALVESDTVSWSIPYDEYYYDHPFQGFCNYSNIAFYWRYDTGGHASGLFGFLANETQQEILSSGYPTSLLMYDPELSGIEVVEFVGDGVFGPGDSIVFNSSSLVYPNEYDCELVFTIGLMHLGIPNIQGSGEYSYAIHDGKFYSWMSHELDWTLPWYHSLMDD
jgi:hypothetical protein